MTQPSEQSIRKACEEAGVEYRFYEIGPEHGYQQPVRRLIEALARRIEAEAVPVAWQVTFANGQGRKIVLIEPYYEDWESVEKLYAAPPKEPTT